ncbi:hypothetical protein ACFWHR_14230 [Leucobacter sp. NPDC058333]|uniref:hypothetical protein n=1 Tax=Leucobacter sp. NPDC058333 TaxID=3346450 RepID=UPI003659CB43
MEQVQTLAERQQRVMRRGGAWYIAGAAVMVGWLCAWLLAMPRLGSAASTAALPFHMIAAVIMLACYVVGLVMLIQDQGAMTRRLTEALSAPVPAVTPVPAKLVRALPASRGGRAQQLLYAAHRGDAGRQNSGRATEAGIARDAVTPVAVALPAGATPPPVGSGAWLAIDPERPDIASFATLTDPAQHDTALQDPALASLTRVQSGLAVPARAYLTVALTGGAVLAVSFVVFSLVLLIPSA